MIATINNAIAKKREDGEKGFTLIELLVVIVIIGILAAIAIPAFLNQRTAAWKAEVESDLKNASLAAETYSAGNAGSYTGLTEAELVLNGFEKSNAATTLTVTATGTPVGSDYTILANHPDLADNLSYDSAAGGLQTWP